MQNPQPARKAVESRYDEAYLDYEVQNQLAYRELEILAMGDLDLETAAAPLRESRRILGRLPRALDVGCATGALLDSLRDRSWEVQGVELCEPAAAYGRARFRLAIHGGTLESAKFESETFEFVHASHLIEHLNEPLEFLAELSRITVPGGLLMLTTPNVDGLQARLFGSDWRSAIYDHLYLFSSRTLEKLMNKAGFKVLRRITWGGWARGLKPGFLKRPLDAWAKALGFGDVVAMLALRGVA